MGIDESVERLAFGRIMPKLDSCAGLFLSEEVVFVSEAHVEGLRPVVDHLVRVPLPSASRPKDTQTRLGGTLNTEILSDTERLGSLLKPAVTHVKWKSDFMVLSLSHHFGLLRYFVMPAIDRKFWRIAVPAEARKHIPIPFAELVYDYQVFPLSPGPDRRPRQGVLFGVTHRKNVEGAAALAGKLGFKLLGVDLAPCSVERLWDLLALQQPVLPRTCLHLDGGWARILISDGGVPIFFREMLLPEEGRKPELRKVDLEGCRDFCKKQFGADVSKDIQLSGVHAEQQAAWTQALARELEMPVQFRDASRALDLKTGEWGSYASIGSALYHLAPAILKVDLGPAFRITNEEKRAVYAVFSLAGAWIAILLLLAAGRLGMSLSESRKLARLQHQREVVPAFQNMTKEQIVGHMQSMEARTRSFGGLLWNAAKLKRILECIAEDIPDSLWLSAVTYADPIGGTSPSDDTVRNLILSGHVLGPNSVDDQEIAFQFKNKLQEDERFSKAFDCNSPKVTANLSSADGGGASSNQGERTAFTIECSAKRQTP